MTKIIPSIITPLLMSVLLLAGNSVYALDKVNVTLPSKSFQFIIFPLAKERGYMREEGIDLNTVIMASTPGLQAVLAGEMDFTGSGSSALVAVSQGNAPLKLCWPSPIRCCSGSWSGLSTGLSKSSRIKKSPSPASPRWRRLC
jgi:ABC-type nitrate/sulfonate/bicarbonate transport system substrate-binding protein